MSIAAPQVNKHLRLFVMCDRAYWYNPKLMYKKFMTVINPEIIENSKEVSAAWEGCLSNEQEVCLVERPKRVKVRYFNVAGKQVDLVCEGLISRIFQHEIDHLDGLTMEDKRIRSALIKNINDEDAFESFKKENKDLIIEF